MKVWWFFSLPEAWISSFKERLSVLSESLLMTSSWAGVLICYRVGRLCRRDWTGWISGLRSRAWESTRWSAGSCPCVTRTMSNTTGWRSGWKDSQWKKTWWCWLTDAGHEPVCAQEVKEASGILACVRSSVDEGLTRKENSTIGHKIDKQDFWKFRLIRDFSKTGL